MFKLYTNGELSGYAAGLVYTVPEMKPLTEQDEAIAELGIYISQLEERIRQLEARIQEGENNG